MQCQIIEPLAERDHRTWRNGTWHAVTRTAYGVRWADGVENYSAPITLRPNDTAPGLQGILNLSKEPSHDAI